MQGDLDADERLGVVAAGGLDDRFGDGVAEPVGMAGQDVLGGDGQWSPAHRAELRESGDAGDAGEVVVPTVGGQHGLDAHAALAQLRRRGARRGRPT